MKEFVVVYEREGDFYNAYAPDLPGCIAGAETFEETRELMAEAIKIYLEELKLSGAAVPEPQSKVGTIQVA